MAHPFRYVFRSSGRCSLAIFMFLAWLGAPGAGWAQDDDVDFERDVAPLLQEHCIDCHGEGLQEGGLRLDVRSAALSGGESGPAVVPGDPDSSELWKRVTTDDVDLRMPYEADPLGEDALALLRTWIEQGAEWSESPGVTDRDDRHWAFQPLAESGPPPVADAAWPRHPLDHFVLAELEARGLRPAEPADRATLIRRVFLDLTGLPPTPRELDDFLADPRPDAYERLVDRLLSSPRYGERWARRWLDLARYADTNGYEKDRPRSMWPYRDWVIRSVNDDVPYDRFTIEQLAGDLLPEPTESQRIATGFHRNTMINEEGGIDVEEFRYYAVVDRVATTGTVWLGLTLGCAQCHTHKYDPISQHEYYQFFAFLNNADEPEMPVAHRETQEERDRVTREIESIETEMLARLPEFAEERAAWEASTTTHDWLVLVPDRVHSQQGATLSVLDDGSVLASGDIPNLDVYEAEFALPAGAPITAVRIEALPHASLPGRGPGRAVFDSGAGQKGDFLLTHVELFHQEDAGVSSEVPVPLFGASETHAGKDRPGELAIDADLDTGWSVHDKTGDPHHVVLQLSESMARPSGGRMRIVLHQHYIHQMTLGRFRISVTAGNQPVVSSGLPAEIEAGLRLPVSERSPEIAQALDRYFILEVAEGLNEDRARLHELRSERPELPTTLVMSERQPEHVRETRMHRRGEFLQPAGLVEPGVPEVLPEFPGDFSPNRLGLAKWLVSPEHPLTARVAVNRQWSAFFGRGLVSTEEDFGTQGEPPSHPEMLDWLAREWIRRGWSTKELHRWIVTSATYRQRSDWREELADVDPDNRLLARGPRKRLEVELIRDQALTVAGLLSTRIGGESVFPPQPPGITNLSYGQLAWSTSEGEDRYRRGFYTFAKRTAPYATFGLFGGPSGEVCVARRPRSTTPLQALTLLNDPVYVEASRGLARRVLSSGDDDRTRMDCLFRLCLARTPDAEERRIVSDFLEGQRRRLANGELEARSILGDAAIGDGIGDLDEWAAWTLAARIVLNLDEMVMVP